MRFTKVLNELPLRLEDEALIEERLAAHRQNPASSVPLVEMKDRLRHRVFPNELVPLIIPAVSRPCLVRGQEREAVQGPPGTRCLRRLPTSLQGGGTHELSGVRNGFG